MFWPRSSVDCKLSRLSTISASCSLQFYGTFFFLFLVKVCSRNRHYQPTVRIRAFHFPGPTFASRVPWSGRDVASSRRGDRRRGRSEHAHGETSGSHCESQSKSWLQNFPSYQDQVWRIVWFIFQYGTDFFMLDKYPLAVRPFYTMPDPNDKVSKRESEGRRIVLEKQNHSSLCRGIRIRTTCLCGVRRSCQARSGSTIPNSWPNEPSTTASVSLRVERCAVTLSLLYCFSLCFFYRRL